MKSAIVFLALVAVSQAAFTGRLQSRAQPILNDALLKMRTAGGRSSYRETEITNTIIQNLQTHANDLLAQIESAVLTGQEVASGLVQSFQSTVAELQQLGSNVHAGAAGILSNFLDSMSGLFGGLFGKGRSVGSLAQTVADLLNQWNLEHGFGGGNIDTNNGVVQVVVDLVDQLGIVPMVQNVMVSMFGSNLANQILNAIKPQGRGLFDNLSAVGSSLTAAAQQALANISSTVSNIIQVGTQSFAELQQLAHQFATDALAQAQETAEHAATQFLEALKPHAQAAGELYNQVVAQVNAIIASLQ